MNTNREETPTPDRLFAPNSGGPIRDGELFSVQSENVGEDRLYVFRGTAVSNGRQGASLSLHPPRCLGPKQNRAVGQVYIAGRPNENRCQRRT
jgi:hypothetical protein